MGNRALLPVVVFWEIQPFCQIQSLINDFQCHRFGRVVGAVNGKGNV